MMRVRFLLYFFYANIMCGGKFAVCARKNNVIGCLLIVGEMVIVYRVVKLVDDLCMI